MPYAINATCNFNCTFCDRNWSREEVVDDASVLRDAPISELSGLRAMLGGGEPTLHPRLPQLLKGLVDQGVGKLAIRSNGAWASRPEPIEYLRKSGLREVSLLFPTDDPELFNQLVRKKGAFDVVMAAVKNLRSARIRLVLRIPLIRPTLATLPDMLSRIPDLISNVRRIDLVMLDIDDPDLQVSVEEINEALPFRSNHPDKRVPPLALDPGPGIPLCWTDKMEGWRIAPDCPTAGSNFPDKCDRCFVQHSCPGLPRGYVKVFGQDIVTPYEIPIYNEDRAPRIKKQMVMKTGAIFDAQKGMTFECAGEAGENETLASVRLRIGHSCNRRCDFCFIPHHEKSVQDYDIPASIAAAASSGARELVVTGGEPTLVPELPAHIRQATESGIRRVLLQTNAIKLADYDFCKQLSDAGLTHITVSLHAHRDDVLKEITGKGNTMHKIVRGLTNAKELGLKTSITHVIGPKNYKHLPEFVEFMSQYVSSYCFIFATPMAWPMATKEIVVRYSDAAPYVMRALDIAIEKGKCFDGLALKCGAPHCVVNGEPKYLPDAEVIPDRNRGRDWIRVPACETCVLNKQCYGVRRLYAWLYGIDEFRPVLEPGKLAVDWKSNAPARLEEADLQAGDTIKGRILAAAQGVGLAMEQLESLITPDDTLEFEVDGQPAYRVRYRGEDGSTMGAVELSTKISSEVGQQSALVRRIRAAAFGLNLGGAHGGLVQGPGDDGEQVAAYVKALCEQDYDGVDYLTPHVSSPWEQIVDAVDAQANGSLSVLRRPRADTTLRMTSVHSAVAGAVAGIALAGGPSSRILRYGVWGYGRAGREFAHLMDPIQLPGGQRPMLIGCCDTQNVWIDQRGLSHERLSGFKTRTGKIPTGAGTVLGPGDVRYEPCDVLVLSGRGAALEVADVPRVRARVVVDMTGALSTEVEVALREAGCLLVPAVIATAGPMVLADLERRGILDAGEAQEAIRSATEAVLADTVALAERTGLPMSEAVLALGLQNMLNPSVPKRPGSADSSEVSQSASA